MKTKRLLICMTLALSLTQCKSGGSGNSSGASDSLSVIGGVVKDTASNSPEKEIEYDSSVRINFLLPSPDEILGEIFPDKVLLNPELVNPKVNASRYIDTRKQALNLGIYITDFAYLNLNENKTNSLEYFKLIRDLAQKVNIYGVFNDAFFDRVQKNLSNKDTLTEISKEVYYGMLGVLESSNRNNIYALVASGALIESLYLSTMVINNLSNYKSAGEKIFEQKFIFNNFYDFASQYQKDEDVKSVLVLFKSMKTILESTETKQKEKKVTVDKKDHFVIGGGENFVVDEKLFKEFKESVSKTRAEIIATSNK